MHTHLLANSKNQSLRMKEWPGPGYKELDDLCQVSAISSSRFGACLVWEKWTYLKIFAVCLYLMIEGLKSFRDSTTLTRWYAQSVVLRLRCAIEDSSKKMLAEGGVLPTPWKLGRRSHCTNPCLSSRCSRLAIPSTFRAVGCYACQPSCSPRDGGKSTASSKCKSETNCFVMSTSTFVEAPLQP